MVNKKTWEEFRSTGLLLIINQILHIFGWAIVMNINDDGEVVDVFPARVKFRGFGEKNVIESYKKVSEYLLKNIEELNKEAHE